MFKYRLDSISVCVCVRVLLDTGHALTAWLTVTKSRPARARQMRKTSPRSPTTLLEQTGEREPGYTIRGVFGLGPGQLSIILLAAK